MSVSYICLSASVLLLPLTIFKVKTFFKVGFFFLIFSAIEIGSIKNLGTSISEGFLEAIFNTNIQETHEQISANVEIILLVVVLAIIYSYLLSHLTIKSIKPKYKYTIIGIFIFLNIGLILKMYMIQRKSDSLWLKIENTFIVTG
ncbi:phosphoethanolamine transferase domain-containing protein, partial [Pseudopedobacter sp.]|uniref:phosphoethanolamine transferase domain-containing protein n=1 Tax=Pseudopedobacter sp. TaxID=1936787 RepID=UPI0033405498